MWQPPVVCTTNGATTRIITQVLRAGGSLAATECLAIWGSAQVTSTAMPGAARCQGKFAAQQSADATETAVEQLFVALVATPSLAVASSTISVMVSGLPMCSSTLSLTATAHTAARLALAGVISHARHAAADFKPLQLNWVALS